jgi:hypothetical protein
VPDRLLNSYFDVECWTFDVRLWFSQFAGRPVPIPKQQHWPVVPPTEHRILPLAKNLSFSTANSRFHPVASRLLNEPETASKRGGSPEASNQKQT